MVEKNETFKLSIAQWRGYVTRALEDIGKDMKEIKADTKIINRRVSKIQVKIAGIGATVALIVTLILNYILK